MKDIVVGLECDKSRDAVCDYAISIAEAFDSHLVGVACGGITDIPAYLRADIPVDVFEELVVERERNARAAIERFEAAARRSLVSAEHRMIARSTFSPPDIFAAIARRFDVSVLMQSDEEKDAFNDLVIEAALFDSGRPLIVVPYIQKDGVKLDRVVCCWDGSRSAARAVNDALPLLRKAKAVELFTVINEKYEKENEIRGADIGSHLARHGLNVEVVTQPAADNDVVNVILSHVADSAAGMIVMGGYGHSRVREFVLGGATHGILASMTVPVLMSH